MTTCYDASKLCLIPVLAYKWTDTVKAIRIFRYLFLAVLLETGWHYGIAKAKGKY